MGVEKWSVMLIGLYESMIFLGTTQLKHHVDQHQLCSKLGRLYHADRLLRYSSMALGTLFSSLGGMVWLGETWRLLH